MATSESSKPAASYWLDSVFDKTSLQDHQKAMIIACESGDLFALRQLFEKYNVKQGDEPMYDFAPESGAPTTWRMIIAAVAHKHSSIVAFLLSVYPEMDILDSPFVQAVIDNPDFDTLNILCAHPHSPHVTPFFDFEFYPARNFLAEACRCSED